MSAGSGTATDVIVLQAEETYALNLVGDGDDAGDLDIRDDPQLAPGIDDVRIVGTADEVWMARVTQHVPGERVLESHLAQTTLTSLWLTSGEAVDGGGLYNAGGVMLLEDMQFESNVATGNGGGIYNHGDMRIRGSALQTTNFNYNSAGNFGGCIHHASGTMHVMHVQMFDSKAFSGGCIYNTAQLMVESVRMA